MVERSRSSRYAVSFGIEAIKGFIEEDSAWYESPAEIARAIRRGRERARLLEWVKQAMPRVLTQHETRAIQLRYLHGLTYRASATALGISPSLVYRRAAKAVEKLRAAARAEGIRRKC